MSTGWCHVVLDSGSASILGWRPPAQLHRADESRDADSGRGDSGEETATVGALFGGVHDVRRGVRRVSGAAGPGSTRRTHLMRRDRDQDLPWTRVPGRLRRTSRVRRWWSLWFALRGVSASAV